MKTGKVIGIILVLVIVLGIAAYFIMQANKKKTAAAVATAPNANPAVTGRVIASTSVNPLSSGKYVFAGNGSPTNSGWCRGGGDLILGPNPDGSYSCYKQTA